MNTPTIKLGVNEVNLIFTVTDKHGHYIPNLQQSDFALLDDSKAPARVNSFHQQINLPLRVGILIDTSTSIRSRFQFEQQSANEFFLEMLKSKSDRAFVMGFDVTPTVTQDWTNNIDGLETGVNRLRPGGGTALFDAVYTACRDKLLDVSRGQEPTRKAIVLLSDGEDNQSHVYLDEAIKECQRAETIIYAISTNWTPSRGKGDKVLAQDGPGYRRPGFLSALGRGGFEQLPRHRRRTAQPVRFDLYAGGLQDGWRLPHHLSLLQRQALPGSSAQGILCAAAVDFRARQDKPGGAERASAAGLFLCVNRTVRSHGWLDHSQFRPLFQYETGQVPFRDYSAPTVHNRLIHRFFLFRSHRFHFPHDEMEEGGSKSASMGLPSGLRKAEFAWLHRDKRGRPESSEAAERLCGVREMR